jgi:hypothetical protein
MLQRTSSILKAPGTPGTKNRVQLDFSAKFGERESMIPCTCMCVCMYVCMCVCMYKCMCALVSLVVCVSMNTGPHTYIHTYINTYIHTYENAHKLYAPYIRTHMLTYLHTVTYPPAALHTHAYILTYSYIPSANARTRHTKDCLEAPVLGQNHPLGTFPAVYV